MASSLHKTTLEYKSRGVARNTSDPNLIVNPDLSAVSGQPKKYWKISGDSVLLMSQSERDAVDAAEFAAAKQAVKNQAKALIDGATEPVVALVFEAVGTVIKAEFEGIKTGNPLVSRTLAEVKQAMKGIVDGQ